MIIRTNGKSNRLNARAVVCCTAKIIMMSIYCEPSSQSQKNELWYEVTLFDQLDYHFTIFPLYSFIIFLFSATLNKPLTVNARSLSCSLTFNSLDTCGSFPTTKTTGSIVLPLMYSILDHLALISVADSNVALQPRPHPPAER